MLSDFTKLLTENCWDKGCNTMVLQEIWIAGLYYNMQRMVPMLKHCSRFQRNVDIFVNIEVKIAMFKQISFGKILELRYFTHN